MFLNLCLHGGEEYLPEEKLTSNLSQAYTLNLNQPVWQIRFDAEAGLIAVECRDAEVLQVSYWVFEAATGAVLLHNYTPTNSWWASLADIKAGLLFLHQMGAKEISKPAGLVAVGVADGKIKWQRSEVSFYGLTQNGLFARPLTEETTALIGLNFETGSTTGRAFSLHEITGRLENFQAERLKQMQVPAHYPVNNNNFEDLSRFIFLKTGLATEKAIDYLETQVSLIIGFYPVLPNHEKTYRVAVFNRQGVLLGQEELGKNLTGMGTDNFFYFREKLFLIKNKKSLLAFGF